MKQIEPLTFVQNNPSHFFLEGKPDPIELASNLASEVMILGACKLFVVRHLNWWLIGSDLDWICNSGLDVERYFSKLVPFPEAGPNSFRSGIFARVFAQSVSISVGGQWSPIKGGDSCGIDLGAAEWVDFQRVLAFEWQ